jgi:2-polyprenyl-3-methyl-5-hydroxy-6-metoxy-1,4-benzoquinol methylase
MNDVSSNYVKYQTGNPVVRRLIDRFFDRVREIVLPLAAESLLDAGCGEGEALARLRESLPERVVAVDMSAGAVAATNQRLSFVEVMQASVYELPFEDRSFDAILCLEVLEHLDDPETAVAELARVSAGDVVISVPHEPWFRLGSMLRGKYLRALGNHPEHVNHWGPKSLPRLLARRFEVVTLTRSFPWLIAHCRRQRAATPSD